LFSASIFLSVCLSLTLFPSLRLHYQPAIEIWNLDVLDPLEPTAVLGGLIEEKKFSAKKGKKGKKQVEDDLAVGSHEAAVMGLSW
jgi:periodic tryptophan protein 1